MDITTILGISLALGAICGGHLLEGGHMGSVLQETAGIIVIGGTIGAVMVAFPGHHLLLALKGVKKAILPPKNDTKAIVEQLVGFAQQARQNGIIAIEKGVADLKDPFMKKALNFAVDGNDANTIRAIMESDLAIEEEEEEIPAKVFESVGGFAPTVGILGAVLGLIHVMENLSDPSKLGGGIAVAFVATVYGVALANLVALPLANKLKLRMKEHVQMRVMMIEGVAGIVNGEDPRLIRDKLGAFVTQGQGGDHGDAGEEKKAA